MLTGAAAIAAALTLYATAGVAQAGADSYVGALSEGKAAFWNGDYVLQSRIPDPSLCGIAGQCFDYHLDLLSSGGQVLRVALSTPDDANNWEVQVIDPSGNVASSGQTYNLIAENFDVELFIPKPAPGHWTLRVIPMNVDHGSFRMRAALDPPTAAPAPPSLSVTAPAASTCSASLRSRHQKRGHKVRPTRRAHGKHTKRHRAKSKSKTSCTSLRNGAAKPRAAGVVDMPPDIAADAPWHMTFEQPLPMVIVEGSNYTNLAGVHDVTPQVGGQPVYGCLPEETIEQGAHRCLRFTSGFASIGKGPFVVYGSSSSPVAVQGGPLYQVIYRSDGSSYSRRAGQFVFHHIHLHYHVLGIARFEIFHVNEPDHVLVPAGKVLKEGFCLGDVKLYDWSSFNQADVSRNPVAAADCQPVAEPDGTFRFYEGITQGWEDSYKWQTSGQFIDFAGNPDGLYVLRVTVNADHTLLDVNPSNDVAYAYFQVSGNSVRVIERGQGTDPWDPSKKVLDPVINP